MPKHPVSPTSATTPAPPPSAPRIDDRFLKKEIKRRVWETARDSWVAFLPPSSAFNAKPDPGLEKLPTLLEISIGVEPVLLPDVSGVRSNAIAEAIYLYRKATNVRMSVENLADAGYQSWCMFNAYHGAYLSAKSILTLFGVPLAYLNRQVIIDLFPEIDVPTSKKRPVGNKDGRSFRIIPISNLDQQGVWKILQRILNTSSPKCVSENLLKQVTGLDERRITPPRNHFLYKAIYWPLEDISESLTFSSQRFLNIELDSEFEGFLLSLFYSVYRILEELLGDLATVSGTELPDFLASAQEWESVFGSPVTYRLFCQQLVAQDGPQIELSQA